jgi:ketosteroid isomerase-like protein
LLTEDRTQRLAQRLHHHGSENLDRLDTMINSLIVFFAMACATSLDMNTAPEVQDADARLNKLIMQNLATEAAALYMDDFLLITSGGKLATKQEIVEQIASPELKLEVNETTEVRVRVHGTTAVLTGILRQQGSWKGKPFDVKLRVTDTWIKTDSGWRLLSGQAGSF